MKHVINYLLVSMVMFSVGVLSAESKVYTTPSTPGFHVKNAYSQQGAFSSVSNSRYSNAYNSEMKRRINNSNYQYQNYRKSAPTMVKQTGKTPQDYVKEATEPLQYQNYGPDYGNNQMFQSETTMKNGLFTSY